ncbi:MAG: BON domain-containing protein [Xanthomonadaceae bacterium]|nr:BON domain-containing protein [Xanthomonadaceae bacterium]
MKTDSQIQTDVMQELKWDPRVTHEHIGVSVQNHIVTLGGSVPSFVEKNAAERAAQRVEGATAVVEKIEVKPVHSYVRDDQDIASSISSVFKWNIQIPGEQIKVSVAKGWVALRGEVDWGFQKNAAEKAVRALIGVNGLFNHIIVKSRVQSADIKQNIEDAFRRAGEREAKNINVSILNGHVTLSGKVHSLSDLREAKIAAWCAPGVTEVEDHLVVTA